MGRADPRLIAGVERATILKAGRDVCVARVRDPLADEVRKVYRHPLRFAWRTLGPARALRERENLERAHRRGLPFVRPLRADQLRRLGVLRSSVLVTEWVEKARPLETVLRELPPADRVLRRRLVAEAGRMLARIHAAGMFWCTARLRNFLCVGPAATGELLGCDAPLASFHPRSIHDGPIGWLDVYDAGFTPGRRALLSRAERYLLVLAYCGGNRSRARPLYRRLARRGRRSQRVRRQLRSLAARRGSGGGG